jgi:hypothetical protein
LSAGESLDIVRKARSAVVRDMGGMVVFSMGIGGWEGLWVVVYGFNGRRLIGDVW